MIPRIGIDIASIDEMATLVKNAKALERVFTTRELNWCRSRHDDFLPALARTFAAKEAAIKALGETEGYLKRIEIVREENHRPEIRWEKLAGNMAADISFGYSHPFAIAAVILLIA